MDWFFWVRWFAANLTIAAVAYGVMRLWRLF